MKIFLFFLLITFHAISSQSQRLIPLIQSGHTIENLSEYTNEIISDMQVYENQLLLCGKFQNILGQSIAKLAVWNGTNISSFDIGLTFNSSDHFYGMHLFQNNLYIYGLISGDYRIYSISEGNNNPILWDTSLSIRSLSSNENQLFATSNLSGVDAVMKFENGNWSSIGNSNWSAGAMLQKANNSLYCLASVNGELVLHKYSDAEWIIVSLPNNLQITAINSIEDELYLICKELQSVSGYGHSIYKLTSSDQAIFQTNFEARNYTPNHVVKLNETFAVSSDSRGVGTVLSPLPDDSYWVNASFDDNRGFGIIEVASFQNKNYSILETQSTGKTFNVIENGDQRIYLENDVLRASFQSTPTQFQNPSLRAALFYKIGSPVDSLAAVMYNYSGWYSAKSGETISTYVPIFNDYNQEGSFGPITNEFDLDYLKRYYRIWKINKSEIEYHQNNFDSPDYVVPIDILEWPAHGDVEKGEADNLAPFVDFNFDGIYNPSDGDYPDIKGDQCVFWMENDKHSFSFVQAENELENARMGLEIMNMAYVFDNENLAIKSSIFFQSKIINRSSSDFDEFRSAIWSDFDNGNSNDDFVGCDSTLQYFYGFNGDAFDESSSTSFGFAEYPTATGIVFLENDMFNHLYYNAGTNPINGDPITDLNHYNYMSSKWKNGQPVMYGGNGVSGADVSEEECNFMFPAYPWEEGWNEINSGNVPGDRRSLGSFTPSVLNSGNCICRNHAITIARDLEATIDPHFASLELLQDQVEEVKSFYQNTSSNCNCIPTSVENDFEHFSNDQIILFPNPGNSVLSIRTQLLNELMDITISTADGRVVYSKTQTLRNGRLDIDSENLESGLYLVQIKSFDKRFTARWVKM